MASIILLSTVSSPSDYDTAPDMIEPVETSPVTPRYQSADQTFDLFYTFHCEFIYFFACKDTENTCIYEYRHREVPKPAERAAPKDDAEEITAPEPPKTLLKIKGQPRYFFVI